MSNAADTLSAEDELDLSGDSAVEIITTQWQITEAEEVPSESDKGTGTYAALVFESQEAQFPITMRFFTEYSPSDPTKNTDWVKRQRGQLKNIVKAAGGDVTRVRDSLTNPNSPNYIVGKFVTATTKDGGDGFAVLGKFKKAE
jgi:hypothetical protein